MASATDARDVKTISDDTDIQPDSKLYTCDVRQKGLVLLLPNSIQIGDYYEAKCDTGACSTKNPITIDGNGNLIDGANVLVLNTPCAFIGLISD